MLTFCGLLRLALFSLTSQFETIRFKFQETGLSLHTKLTVIITPHAPCINLHTITMPFLCVLSLLFLFSLEGFQAVLGETRATVYHPMNVFRGTEFNCFSRNSCIEGK